MGRRVVGIGRCLRSKYVRMPMDGREIWKFPERFLLYILIRSGRCTPSIIQLISWRFACRTCNDKRGSAVEVVFARHRLELIRNLIGVSRAVPFKNLSHPIPVYVYLRRNDNAETIVLIKSSTALSDATK